MKIKVGVIFGGDSVEHEVSIITAVQAMEFLDKNKYEIVPIYISKNRDWYTGESLLKMDSYKDLENIDKLAMKVCLTKKDNTYALIKMNGLFQKVINTIDVAFPIVHGKGVEDGSLAGYLDTLGLPYVGCDMLGASVGQDKVVQKQIMQSANIPVPDYVWFYENEYYLDEKKILKEIEELTYPVVVKPAHLGSSIGITYVKSKTEIEEAIKNAIEYDNKIIVEKAVPNILEVDCAAVGNYEWIEVSAIGKMLTDNDFLTFEDKYLGSGSKKTPGKKVSGDINTSGFEIPAKIDKKIEEDIIKYTKESFRVLNLRGITRFDFLVDSETKKVYVNEPNTIPGCLAFFFFKPKNINYQELLDKVITMTIKDYKNLEKKITSFESNVLSTFNGSGGSKNKMSL